MLGDDDDYDDDNDDDDDDDYWCEVAESAYSEWMHGEILERSFRFFDVDYWEWRDNFVDPGDA